MDLNDEGTDDGHHDAAPLLSTRQSSDEHLTNPQLRPTSCSRPRINVVVLCVAIAITVDICEYLLMTPRLRLYESILCSRYYMFEDPSLIGEDGFVLEKYCKVDGVQNDVAMIFGGQYFSDSLAGILLPTSHGYLADKYGRKWITV